MLHTPIRPPLRLVGLDALLERTFWQTLALSTLCRVVRLSVGAHFSGTLPEQKKSIIFFANHTSHLDTLTLISALPGSHRKWVRPVAAKDYWDKGILRRWVARNLLHVVFIERGTGGGTGVLEPLRQALREGYSLIFFPEGTRHAEVLPQSFRGGLYYLYQEFHAQGVALCPVYLENLQRIFPKGAFVPLPLLNTVHFGGQWMPPAPELISKEQFLIDAHARVCALYPRPLTEPTASPGATATPTQTPSTSTTAPLTATEATVPTATSTGNHATPEAHSTSRTN